MVSSEGTQASLWMNLFNNIVKAQDKYLTKVPVTWCPVVCIVLAVTSAFRVDIAGFRELSQLLSNSVLRQSLSLNRELMYLLGWLAVKAPQIKFLEMKVSCQS